MPINRSALVAVLALAALNGCASRPTRVAVAAPPPAAPLAPMPQPPVGAYAGMTIPTRLPNGSYPTPNQHLGDAATIWHLRVALNVAALGCHGAERDTITAGYNAMLGTGKAQLAKANTQTIAAEGGQAAYDEAMTRLYNFFAQPQVNAAFCAAASKVVAQLSGSSGSLAAVAPAALAELDAPFVQFYRAYDAYRVELAGWQADRLHRALQPVDEQPGVALAIVAPASEGKPSLAGKPRSAPRLDVDPAVFRMP